MKKGVKLSLWILPTAVLCGIVGFRVALKGHSDRRSPQEIRFQAATNQMALWNEGAEYRAIEATETFKADLHELLATKTGLQINADQDMSLQDSIYDFLMAYHEGDYSVYTRFRMAAVGEISPKHLPVLRNFVSKNSKQPLASVSALPQDELFRQFVEIRSKGTLYKNYFSSVSLKKSQVEVNGFNQIPEGLKPSVFSGTTNLGVASFEPMFTFDRNPEKILQQDGTLICATVVLYIRTKEPHEDNMPVPVYLRLTWDAESKRWLPSELATGNIWQKSEIILAF